MSFEGRGFADLQLAKVGLRGPKEGEKNILRLHKKVLDRDGLKS